MTEEELERFIRGEIDPASIRANADLADKTILRRWYSAERLGSDCARRTFVLPDPSVPIA